MAQVSVTEQTRPRVIFDVHQYQLPAEEEHQLREHLDGLARQVENFPVADLHVLIEGNARSNDVSVKLTLVLPGTTLVASDHDAVVQPAFERCLDSLLDNLSAYKERLSGTPEQKKAEKGTAQELHPTVPIDTAAVEAAVKSGDYPAFHLALLPYEEALRKLVGRWVQRYPEFEKRIGHGVEIADMVEDVFLAAFEGYQDRPDEVPLGTWLVGLIDPVVKALQQKPDIEQENIEMARSARAAGQGADNI
jgi:ribosome-associated translation inhibitor RaiA